MKEKVFKIFVDFDGTITKQDVGEAIFNKFGETEEVKEIIIKLLSDEISSRECWNALCESAKIKNKKELDQFIEEQEIDETFNRFVEYCDKHKMDLLVLSDGFDYYIKRIFEKEGLDHLNFYANKLKLTADNNLIPSYPHFDKRFESSANCKRNHIINNSADDDFTVFIGDGNSDKLVVEYCDFIFAKDDLLKYCEIERITYFPFKNFNDVIDKMETLRNKKRLKKRHQAELKRKEAYMME